MAWVEQLLTADWQRGMVCLLGAYVLGCFATGYYLVRLRTGRDIRDLASGSVGAKNVGRLLGRWAFVLTVLGDGGKGVLAVWVTRHFTGDPLLTGLALLAVVVGHIWPAQLRFQGGKGVATSLGGLLMYDGHLACAYAIFFLAAVALTRKATLPGLFAFACLPLTSYWLGHPGLKLLILALLTGVVLFAHRRNLIEEIPALAARRAVAPKTTPPKP